jgi:hypothetical protein
VEQQLSKWLSPGRRQKSVPRLTADDIRTRYSRNTPDPYGEILRQADSLLLQPNQVTALQEAQSRAQAHTDSMWMEMAHTLAELGDDYNVRLLVASQNEMADSVWEFVRSNLQATLPAILTPIQLRLLPNVAADLYRAPKNRKNSYFFF